MRGVDVVVAATMVVLLAGLLWVATFLEMYAVATGVGVLLTVFCILLFVAFFRYAAHYHHSGEDETATRMTRMEVVVGTPPHP